MSYVRARLGYSQRRICRQTIWQLNAYDLDSDAGGACMRNWLRGSISLAAIGGVATVLFIDGSADSGPTPGLSGAPNAMFRRGFTRDSLPVGTQIVVRGYQARDGGQRANGRDLTLADGQRLFLGGSNPESAEEDP